MQLWKAAWKTQAPATTGDGMELSLQNPADTNGIILPILD